MKHPGADAPPEFLVVTHRPIAHLNPYYTAPDSTVGIMRKPSASPGTVMRSLALSALLCAAAAAEPSWHNDLRLPLPAPGGGLAWDGEALWFAAFDGQLFTVDPEHGTTARQGRVRLDGGRWCEGLAFVAGDPYLHASAPPHSDAPDQILRLSADDLRIKQVLPYTETVLGPTPPGGQGMTEDGWYLWTLNPSADAGLKAPFLTRVDPFVGIIQNTLPLPLLRHEAQGVAYSLTRKTFFVLCADRTLYRIPLGYADLDNEPTLGGLEVYAPPGGTAWRPEDLAWDGNALWFVDTAARAIVRLRLPS